MEWLFHRILREYCLIQSYVQPSSLLAGYAKRTALRQQLLSDITKRRHDEQQKRFQAFEEEVGDTEQKEDNDEDEPEESDGDFEVCFVRDNFCQYLFVSYASVR